MKKRYIFYLLLGIIFQTSCRSTKDITMLQELSKNTIQYYIPNEAPEHKIRPFDNLYLSILTLDSEVNALFNPSIAGTGMNYGTQNSFGSPANQYVNGYMVNANGVIELPILGEIELAGLSLEEAQVRVKMRAEEYLKEPSVQVKLLNYKLNITGEVKSPGVYYNYDGSITILDLISMAGGITEYAEIKSIKVNRPNGNRIQTHNIDLTNNSVYASDFYYLQPNDLVYIPPGKLVRRNENASTYSQILGTLSIILVAISIII